MTIGDGDNFDAGVINAHLDELLAATSGAGRFPREHIPQ